MVENMVEIVKLVYVMIIFLSLFLVAINIKNKPILSCSNFLSYLLDDIYPFSVHLM